MQHGQRSTTQRSNALTDTLRALHAYNMTNRGNDTPGDWGAIAQPSPGMKGRRAQTSVEMFVGAEFPHSGLSRMWDKVTEEQVHGLLFLGVVEVVVVDAGERRDKVAALHLGIPIAALAMKVLAVCLASSVLHRETVSHPLVPTAGRPGECYCAHAPQPVAAYHENLQRM